MKNLQYLQNSSRTEAKNLKTALEKLYGTYVFFCHSLIRRLSYLEVSFHIRYSSEVQKCEFLKYIIFKGQLIRYTKQNYKVGIFIYITWGVENEF